MTSITSIPQELIDKIIDQLHTDQDTLKACAVVSRSFLSPSRRHLYYSIDLGDSFTISVQRSLQKLYDILKSHPDIASLIREFHILLVRGPAIFTDWIEEDVLLQGILGMTQLQLLSLNGTVYHSTDMWDDIPINIQSAVLQCFQSPTLTEVRLNCIGTLPTSVIATLTHVRRLSLRFFAFRDDLQTESSNTPTKSLEHLEALDLGMCGKPLPETVSFLVQKLRLLSIGSCDSRTLTSAQTVISSGHLITTVIWTYCNVENSRKCYRDRFLDWPTNANIENNSCGDDKVGYDP